MGALLETAGGIAIDVVLGPYIAPVVAFTKALNKRQHEQLEAFDTGLDQWSRFLILEDATREGKALLAESELMIQHLHCDMDAAEKTFGEAEECFKAFMNRISPS